MALGYHGGNEDKAYVEGWLSPDVSKPQTTNWHLYTGTQEGVVGSTQAWLYSDGVFLSGGHPVTGGWNGSTFHLNGYNVTGGEETCDCEVAEVVMYDRKLSDLERKQVEDYLRWKWMGIAAPVTHYGRTSLALTAAVSTAATRRTTGTILLPVAFAKAVSGRKQTFGQVARPTIFSKTVAGQKKTFSVVTRSTTVTFTTLGRRKCFGVVARPITFTKAVTGQRKSFGVVSRTVLFSTATQAGRKTFATVTLPISFSATTLGQRRMFGTIALPITWQAAVAGFSVHYEPPPTDTLLGATFFTPQLLGASADGDPKLLSADEILTEILSIGNGDEAELGSAGGDTPVLGGVS
jgi:hypothetical protein